LAPNHHFFAFFALRTGASSSLEVFPGVAFPFFEGVALPFLEGVAVPFFEGVFAGGAPPPFEGGELAMSPSLAVSWEQRLPIEGFEDAWV
jgi:hypothetical protein